MNSMVMNAPPMAMHAPYPPSWGAVGVFPAPFPVHPFAGFVYPPMFAGPFGHGMPPVAHLPESLAPTAARAAQQPSAKRQKTKGAQDKKGGGPEGPVAGKKTPLAAAKVSSIDSRANSTARLATWAQVDDRPSLCFPAWNCEPAPTKPLRIHLTSDQAKNIYTLRPGQHSSTGSSLVLAKKFGVSVKTIRDIWNRETWVKATRALWTPDEHQAHITAQIAKLESAAAIKGESEEKRKEPARIVPQKRSLPDDETAGHSGADAQISARPVDETSPEKKVDVTHAASGTAAAKSGSAAEAFKPLSAACALRCESAADADAVACLLTLQYAR